MMRLSCLYVIIIYIVIQQAFIYEYTSPLILFYRILSLRIIAIMLRQLEVELDRRAADEALRLAEEQLREEEEARARRVEDAVNRKVEGEFCVEVEWNMMFGNCWWGREVRYL